MVFEPVLMTRPSGRTTWRPKNVIPGSPVFGPFDPAGIGGHIAAQGADLGAAGIGGEKKAVPGQGLVQVGVDHAGLDNGQPVFNA